MRVWIGGRWRRFWALLVLFWGHRRRRVKGMEGRERKETGQREEKEGVGSARAFMGGED